MIMNACYLAVTAALLLMLTACGGDNNSQMAQAQESDLLQDDAQQNDPLQCDAPVFDVAELLFTESDRQWFCSVTTDQLTTEDQVFFSRAGTATMTRFRDVFWNRSLTDQSITVASPFISLLPSSRRRAAKHFRKFFLGQWP